MQRRRFLVQRPPSCHGRVVTKVSPAGEFWETEPEHQDYLEHYPNGYTCHSRTLTGNCRGAPVWPPETALHNVVAV